MQGRDSPPGDGLPRLGSRSGRRRSSAGAPLGGGDPAIPAGGDRAPVAAAGLPILPRRPHPSAA